jgi:hypothetical protein
MYGKSSRSKDGYTWSCKLCRAKHVFDKYHSDPVFRRKRLDGNLKYIKRRYETDPEFRERNRLYHRDLARKKVRIIGTKKPTAVCKIITEHHNLLKDDPEHLPTSFIQKLVGVECEI